MVHEQKGFQDSTAAECLVERMLDHIDVMHRVIAFADAALIQYRAGRKYERIAGSAGRRAHVRISTGG
jgi:hypothetical protein